MSDRLRSGDMKLIEPAEPADTILAPAPLPRCGAAGVRRAPRAASGDKAPGRIDDGASEPCTGLAGSNGSSTRANCWVFKRSTSSKPSAPMSRMEYVQRTTRDGVPPTTSTTTLARRTRCPAKPGTRATSSRRSVRMKAVLAGACSVPSARSRNNFDDRPIGFAFRVSRGPAGGRADPNGRPASSKCAPRCGTSGRPRPWRRRGPGQPRPHPSRT